MARNARNWMEYPPNFKIYSTRHGAGLCLPLVVIMAIGSTTARVWSQENVAAEERTGSTSQKVAKGEPVSAQDL